MSGLSFDVTTDTGRKVMSWADTVRVNKLNAMADALQEALRAPVRRPTEEEDQAVLACNRRVREHNARVLAERERQEAARQRRENEREAAKVRKSMCGECFTVLPASGVCGNCC
ncbi:hypothetical protein GA0070610_1753 [Micromonospora echinofusca]|uniref:Uncharacterized protein n=1 Tax=Micromonospora echinofusca TaxID=47858 RepID=A0A1C5G6N6_MICEH|nr:hypothetical protein [Micromonospora echinofusca]SCG15519.1 hypothetical protein GA0070610_1753 [Micromonospora echinofusca]